jgi:hypothetical protein
MFLRVTYERIACARHGAADAPHVHVDASSSPPPRPPEGSLGRPPDGASQGVEPAAAARAGAGAAAAARLRAFARVRAVASARTPGSARGVEVLEARVVSQSRVHLGVRLQ